MKLERSKLLQRAWQQDSAPGWRWLPSQRFGALLQLHAITAKSFWLDEGSSITMARLDWFNFLRILWRREMNMVLTICCCADGYT